MNNQKNILFVALLASTMTSSSSLHAWLADFDAIEEFMEQQIEDSLQSMKQIRKQCKRLPTAQQTISLNTNDSAATITIHNIEADNIDAHLNNENTRLSIATPNKKITIETRHNILGIETKETIEQKTKDDTQKDIVQFIGTSISRQESFIAGKPLLEKQTIDYNPDTKDLIITIPLQQTSKGKTVIINKLPKKEVATSQPTTISTEKMVNEK